MPRFYVVVLFAALLNPTVSPAKDPADYPLSVHILHAQWNRDRHGVHHGWGRGNIREGDTVRGFDYSFDGCTPFRETISPQKYPAKWKKPQLQLQVLVSEIGKVNKFETCNVNTSLIEGVYMRGPGGIRALSQEQFKAWRVKRDAIAASQYEMGPVAPPSASPSVTPAAALAHLSITSTPAGADIDIDGKFLGSTPSTLDLAAGDHQITVRKKGYKDWTRRMTLVAGLVNLSAELEQLPMP